jgi:molybdopterin molybdotransferase
MLTVTQALDAIFDKVEALPHEVAALSNAQGLYLGDDVLADVDSPPFDKALMDGYAVLASDITNPPIELKVIEEVTAGRVPQQTVSSGEATRIMTGAPIPGGADCVIKVEETETLDNAARVRILADSAVAEQNLIRQATSMKSGDVVLPGGRLLRAQELAALAEMGTHRVVAHRQPSVAVLATGDELVAVDQIPGPGQIRNSNETMLAAQIQRAGAISNCLGVAKDEREHLRARISEGLKHDVLLLSGGVSAGKLDLVPSELEHAGVTQVFHKVQVKPGKPIWFGVLRQAKHVCYVFGLPGNPVSSMVCFELFVRSALRQLMGDRNPDPKRCSARLTHSHSHKDSRETFFPAFVDESSNRFEVTLMKWHGSSDLQCTTNANAMAVFPAEPKVYSAGDSVPVIRW